MKKNHKKLMVALLAATLMLSMSNIGVVKAIDVTKIGNGSIVIGEKHFELSYANDATNIEEIQGEIIKGGSIFVKDFTGNWVDNLTGLIVSESVVSGGVVVPPIIIPPAVNMVTTRVVGKDNYETSMLIADKGWSTARKAIIVSGNNFAEAIGASALSKLYDAPILLSASTTLNASLKAELLKLKVGNVIIIGNEKDITVTVEKQIKELGIITKRISGSDKFETAVNIANELDNVQEIAVVNVDNFTDAVSIAPIAALKNMPILLVDKDSVPGVVAEYIASHNISKTYVIGSNYVISDSVASEFKNVKRIKGYSTTEKNRNVMDSFKAILNFNTVYSVTAKSFSSSVTGISLAIKNGNPIAFVSEDDNRGTREVLRDKTVVNNVLLGAEAVIKERKAKELFGDIVPITAKPYFDKLATSGNYTITTGQEPNVKARILTPKNTALKYTITEDIGYSYVGGLVDRRIDFSVAVTKLDIDTRKSIKALLKLVYPESYETAYMYFIVTARREVYEGFGYEETIPSISTYLDDKVIVTKATPFINEKINIEVGLTGSRLNVFGVSENLPKSVKASDTDAETIALINELGITEYTVTDYEVEREGNYLEKLNKYYRYLGDESNTYEIRNFDDIRVGIKY
jgi:putative cell wall-binding protein